MIVPFQFFDSSISSLQDPLQWISLALLGYALKKLQRLETEIAYLKGYERVGKKGGE